MLNPVAVEHPESLVAHPLADVWLPLPPDQLRELADDIRRRGLVEPIVLLCDRVLDGRSRLEACRLAGVTPRFVVYSGTDPVSDVLFTHLYRRGTGDSTRALAAAQVVRLTGDPSATGPKWTYAAAARAVGVGVGKVRTAVELLERGSRELRVLVARGEVSLDAARLLVRDLPAADQTELVRGGGAKAVRSRVSDLRKAAKEANREVIDRHGPSPFAPAAPAAPLPPRTAKIAEMISRLTGELTALLHQPAGQRFVEYNGRLKLGWIDHSGVGVESDSDGKKVKRTAKFIALTPLRRLLIASAKDRRYGEQALAKLLDDAGTNVLDGTTVPADEPGQLVIPETL